MKKNILLLLLVTGAGLVLTFIGCSKDDTTAPVVTLIGAESIELSLNSGTWSDLGATANDDVDGAISTVTSDASSTNPNVNKIGFYTITYTATDKAGNIGSITRSIYVKNDADDYAGFYNVIDTVNFGSTYYYTQEITVDSSINNRVHFSRFGDYQNNTFVYAEKLGNGNLQIPQQSTPNSIGNLPGCGTARHQFSSSVSAPLPGNNGFTMDYLDDNIDSGCTAHLSGTLTYTRQ